MWTTILSLFLKALRAILDAPESAPTIVGEAARAATAKTELHEEQAANDILRKGVAARAVADARRLHDGSPTDAVDADPAAPVNRSPDAHFRD